MDTPAPPPQSGEHACGRWEQLWLRREPFLLRARDCAALTIPSILPPRGHAPTSKLPQPYQGLGARGVTNLSNRLMMALLPAGTNHFRLGVPPRVLIQQGVEVPPEDLANQLAQTEDLIQDEVDRLNWRQITTLTTQELIITGNALEQMLPDNNLRVYRLDQYIVLRDHVGHLVEILIKEALSIQSLSEDLRALAGTAKDGDTGQNIHLYTWVKRRPDGDWDTHQELEEKMVPGSQGKYKKDYLPFWPLRWIGVIGEDYGRGHVEAHFSDLTALDGLTKAMVDGAAMASRNVTMIRPNAAGGLNLRRRIVGANNGDIIVGNPEDVMMLNFANANGMQFTAATVEKMRQDLGAAFLLNSAMRRDAERVTATELRQDAEELDGALGGVYSMLSQEMAYPRLNRLMFQMRAQKALPDWPDGMIEPTVLTGVEALGRERDVQKVAQVLQMLQGIPPEVTQMYPKWSAVLDKVFIGSGLPDCVRTDAEVEQMQKQQALMQALQNAAPNVANNLTQGAPGNGAGPQAQQ
jgi:hypothetical protein